jgi:hypothetical protein
MSFEISETVNRINVALLRAKALALVFGAPLLSGAKCYTVAQLRLVNTLCGPSSGLELAA